ncbi:MAG: DUF2339 domain-containing protein [Thermoanaerobaculia bacterium]|nr:DUF2339 domain-containing protein [Thermoanaerobaculia bacterium]
METLLGFFGCAILLGFPLALVVFLVKLSHRVKAVETQLQHLSRQVESRTPDPIEDQPEEAMTTTAADLAPATRAAEVEQPLPSEAIVSEPRPPTPEADSPAALEAPPAERTPPTPELAAPELAEPGPAARELEPTQDPWWTGLEEKIWTRLPVWLGAIALTLAAAYLVKLSFDRGWITPAARVAAGILGGVALLVAGDRLRRSSGYVAQGLSAAGIATLFVAFWAAANLYALVPWWLGFALMALTTATAVLLSLRQGYLVAILGLVGGFVTPALVSSDDTRPWALFSYLLLLQLGLVIVSRRRAWGSLGIFTLGGGFLWFFAFVGFGQAGSLLPKDAIWAGLFLLASVASFCFHYVGRDEEETTTKLAGVSISRMVGWGALGGGQLAAATLTFRAGFGWTEWAVLTLLAVACYVLARLDESYQPLAWLASLVVTLQLGSWQKNLTSDDLGTFLATHIGLGVLFAGLAWLFARGTFFRKPSKYPGTWASLSAVVVVAFFLLLVAGQSELGLDSWHWGLVAAALGAILVAGCLPFARARRADRAMEKPLAAMAVGATVLLSMALPLELERQWLTVSWALEVAALLWLSGRLDVPVLRHLAWLLTAATSLRLLLNPAVLTYPIGTMPIVNWLLYGYGIPIVAFLVAARWSDQQNDRRFAEALRWLTLGLGFAFVTLQVRQYFFPGDLDASDSLFFEWATYLVAWSAMAWVGVLAARRWPRPQLSWGGRALSVLTVVLGSLSLGLSFNPLFRHEFVGTVPVFNGLLWGYGVPAILLFLVLLALRREERSLPVDGALQKILSAALLLDLFTLVSLQVRHAFRATSEHAGFLDRGAVGVAENYAYSIAWIVLGVTLALLGRRHKIVRWGSLCVLLPATLKVFLYDTSELEGLWRVASLVGLGVSLMALAYFFQRFVFRPELRPIADEEESADAGP